MPSFFQKVGLYFSSVKLSFVNSLLSFGVNYNFPRVQRLALYFLPNLEATMTKAVAKPIFARKLLASPVIQNRLIENDNKLLRWAISNNQESMVDLLLENDTVKNSLNNNDNALLVWAVTNNFERYWKKLVAFTNVVDQYMSYFGYHYPTLYWAASNNHQPLFDFMIRKRRYQGGDFFNTFEQAIKTSNLDFLQHLMKNYINKFSSEDFKHFFKLAVDCQNANVMHQLLSNEVSKKAILPTPDDTKLDEKIISGIIFYVAGIKRHGLVPRDIQKDNVEFKIDAMKQLLPLDVVKKAIEQFGAVELFDHIAGTNDLDLTKELLTHDVFFNNLASEGNKFLLDTITRNQNELSKFLLTMPPVREELNRQYADNLEKNSGAIKLFQSIAANQELHEVFKTKFPELNLDLPCLKIKAESKKPLITGIYDSPKLVLPLTFSRSSSSAASSPVEEHNEEVNPRPVRSQRMSLDLD